MAEPGGNWPALTVDGRTVATYRRGDDLDATLAPRPYLHPVRTPGGTVVSATRPDDHPWHLGVGVALQDVGGVNLWGGPTYVRGAGYVRRGDHGRVVHLGWRERRPDGFVQDLAWLGPDGGERLREVRRVVADPAPGDAPAWLLSFDYTLHNTTGAPLALGSPATNGRAGAGYGGWFWRLPACHDVALLDVHGGSSEAAVHGSDSPWLVLSCGLDDGGAATLAFARADAADDRWFVRVDDYPGVCSAVAFTTPRELAAGASLRRRVRCLIADGRMDARDAAASVAP